MCGIALQYSPGRTARRLDLNRIRHRGPDGEGQWWSEDRSCWLGHTRLSILDLSENGAQPMADAVTGTTLIFNGEIYNHRALRGQLQGERHGWRSDSDTETLLIAYRRWGRSLPTRLKGMFAVALYDERSRSVLVFRDRLGIKPVYYTWHAGVLSVASEVRVLLDTVDAAVSPASISAYLSTGACPEEQLLWSGVHCLPPGCILTLNAEGVLHTEPYWTPGQARRGSRSNPVAHVRELLEYSVEDHLQSDVPVATFLSGGVDSSIIAALAAQKMSKPLLTFSVGFPQRRFDETAVAAEVAKRYRTEHHRIELDEAETVFVVCEAVKHLDLPSVDAINSYIVARAVAKHGVKVALSGLGGDELFGGYAVFREMAWLQWLARAPQAMRRMLVFLGGWGQRLEDLPRNNAAVIARWRRRFMTARQAVSAGLPPHSMHIDAPMDSLPDDFAKISWSELVGYMRDMLLRDADQMTMATSLELRVPFLDHELVDYVVHLPVREKTRYGGTKGLLVESCRDLLPTAVFQRPKSGFGLPMGQWMRGPLADFAARGIQHVRSRHLMAPDYLATLEAGFRAGRVHWTRIWSVVVLGHYLNNRSPQAVQRIPAALAPAVSPVPIAQS